MDALKLSLIFPDKRYVKYMSPITNTSIFEDSGKTITENGLYSQEIFGTVGSKARMSTFAYIDLYVDILHPRIYEYVISLSPIYEKIMMGTIYATFDEDKRDFVSSDITTGFTGYNFFMEHIHKIKFRETNSKIRKTKISLMYKYIKEGTLTNNKLLVLPAGLREFSIDKSGVTKEVDINDLYRNVINSGRLLSVLKDVRDNDKLKFKLQHTVQELYKHLLYLLGGKRKIIQGQWMSRAVEFKARTVAIGTEDIIEDLDNMTGNMTDTSVAGLALYLKSIDPIAKGLLQRHFIHHIFKNNNDIATVINKDTLLPEDIEIPSKVRDRWTTSDGMDSILNTMLDNEVKNEYIMLGKSYLSVVVEKGNSITRYLDPYDIPEEDKKFIRPITYGELFYIAIYEVIGKLPGFIVRYPITEQGSLVLTKVRVATTGKYRTVKYSEVGVVNREFEMVNYPNRDSNWINGLSVSYTRTSGLGLDFDGDELNLLMALSDESISEINEALETTIPYIGPDGKTMLSASDAVTDNVFKFMTRGI